MSAIVEAIREQNQLISEQNELLRQITMQAEVEESQEGRTMTERDLQLILMSDNILAAIDRWNASRRKSRRPSL